MTQQDIKTIFQAYLEKRYKEASALTPGQKLEVIEQLEREARRDGLVPTGYNSVSRLPVDNPAVQAVLRGDTVSLGNVSVSETSTGASRLADLPTPYKIGILALIMLVFLVLAGFMAFGGGKRNEPTPTPSPSPSPSPTTIPTPTIPPSPTVVLPTPPPPPTSTPTQAFLVGIGGPAENSRDPASIEIAQRLFIVARGQVKEDGTWVPQGPEWLEGTEVRRVFAVPYEQLQDATINPGDLIFVRTRGGSVISYSVRDVVTLQANQIESFFSLRPSLVVVLPFASGDVNRVERVVIFGEAKDDTAAVEFAPQENAGPAPATANAYTLGGVNLRENPGLNGKVLIGLPDKTPLVVVLGMPPVTVDELVWVYVLSPYGYGWVAKQMIAMP